MTDNDNFNTPSQDGFEDMGEEQDYSSPVKTVFDYANGVKTEERDIRREIKNAALITTVPFLILFGISYYWSYLFFFIVDLFGISRHSAALFVQDSFVQNILQIILSSLMFLFPFSLILAFQKKSVSDVVALIKPKKSVSFLYYLVGFSFCMLANMLVSLAGMFFSDFGVDYSVNFGQNPRGALGFTLMIISTAVVPALVEEFACRGVTLGLLLPYGEAFAVVVSSLLFGVMHGNFEQMPFAFLVGIILGYIRIKTNSLWICILIHFSNNMFSVANDYLSMEFSNAAQYIFYVVFICALLVLGILAIVILENKNENFDFEKTNDGARPLDKYKWYLTAPTTVLFLLLFLVKAIKYFN